MIITLRVMVTLYLINMVLHQLHLMTHTFPSKLITYLIPKMHFVMKRVILYLTYGDGHVSWVGKHLFLTFKAHGISFLTFFFFTDPKLIQIFESVLCDQLLYSPIFLFLFFTYSTYVMESGNDDTLRIKMQKAHLYTLGHSLIVWPIT